MPSEREFKADVAESFVLPDLDGVAGLRAQDRGVRALDATYWDTDDLRLLRGGYGLRHRTTDGGSGLWTLKAGSHREGGAMVREETEVAGPPDHLPAAVAARIREVAAEPELHAIAHMRSARRVVELSWAGRPFAEIADDTVTVLDGDREVHRFREVELELHGGDDARAEQVLAALRQAGAGEPTSSSKYVRALEALGHDVASFRHA